MLKKKLKNKKGYTLIELIISIGIILILSALVYIAYKSVVDAKNTVQMKDAIIQVGEGMKSNLKPDEMLALNMIEGLPDEASNGKRVHVKGHNGTPYLFWVGGSASDMSYTLEFEDTQMTPSQCVAMFNTAKNYFEDISVGSVILKSQSDNEPKDVNFIINSCAEETKKAQEYNGGLAVSLYYTTTERAYIEE